MTKVRVRVKIGDEWKAWLESELPLHNVLAPNAREIQIEAESGDVIIQQAARDVALATNGDVAQIERALRRATGQAAEGGD
jgi:hypothetical protein